MSLQQHRPDPELLCAITVTTTELDYVRKLLELRPDDPRRVTDELEVLARLARPQEAGAAVSVNPDIRCMFQHWCPCIDAPINEFDPAIIDCRCYTSREFFAAQDALAVKLDLERGAAE